MDDRFRITGVLGSGGMGCVYLAEHVSIRRPVALKILHPEVEADDEVSKRFEREAFAIGRVDHPNCVNVSDFGKLEDGTLYMVLEVLDGVLLSKLLAEECRIEWQRALHIARHVLSALAYAHGAGIIHRDVKPENVILVEEGGDKDFAKILDFGIAKLHDDEKPNGDGVLAYVDPTLTQIGSTIGTPTSIAPEQAFGQAIDQRADLYALSVMLFEMIAGVPPFESDDVGGLLSMHAAAEVPRLADVAPELSVPEAVEQMIRCGLEKDKGKRIATAAEYIERIDEITAGLSGLREIPGILAENFRESIMPAVARAVKTQRKRTPKQKAALTFLIMGMISVMAFAFGSKRPSYLPARGGVPLIAPKHGPEAKAAAVMLEQGRPADATEYLRAHKKKVREDPYALMVLGHAHASEQRNILALAAYEKAVTQEPKLGKDELMRTTVDLMLDKKAPGVVEDAIDFLGVLATRAEDERAREQLVALASSSEIRTTRQHAMRVADELGFAEGIDRLSAYLLDLQQGETCADRKAAVAKLRALGDKRAISALTEAQNRIRTEGLLKRKVNDNACLRTAAEEAVRYLESL